MNPQTKLIGPAGKLSDLFGRVDADAVHATEVLQTVAVERVEELIAVAREMERARAVDSPNVRWTRAEIARSRIAWREQARAALAKARGFSR